MNRRELLKGLAAAPVATALTAHKPRQMYIHDVDKTKARVLVEGVDADFSAQWDAAFGTKLKLRAANFT